MVFYVKSIGIIATLENIFFIQVVLGGPRKQNYLRTFPGKFPETFPESEKHRIRYN